MDLLIEHHFGAELRADAVAAAAVYTEDVELDVVGAPDGPIRGRIAAQRFYEQLYQDLHGDERIPLHMYRGDDHAVVEQEWHGTVPGIFLGLAGGGRRITFRVVHIFELRTGKICRHNVWIDRESVLRQLRA